MRDLPLGLCHATSVTIDNQAMLIVGPSGAGKSALALRLMALGAMLISDDQTLLETINDRVCASPAPGLEGLIEARQVGILRAEHQGPTPIKLVVDLDIEEQDRLPQHHFITVHKQKIDLIHAKAIPDIEYALIQWMKGGRVK